MAQLKESGCHVLWCDFQVTMPLLMSKCFCNHNSVDLFTFSISTFNKKESFLCICCAQIRTTPNECINLLKINDNLITHICSWPLLSCCIHDRQRTHQWNVGGSFERSRHQASDDYTQCYVF